jgi:preprotein translocase subunit SecF
MAGVLQRLYRGETRIDFIGSRLRWYAASGVLILICVISFIFRGFNEGVEFKGGSTFQIPVAGNSITAAQAGDAFTAAGAAPGEAPQVVGSGSNKQIVVNTAAQPGKVQDIRQSVAQSLHIDVNQITAKSFSSRWGHDTTVTALQGLVIFLIAVSIYISLRFQWRMVTPSTIVGLLTILGFSLYDTVVVYDKVAENAKDILAGSRMTFSEAANLAVNQTLMRSINTSLIALLPVGGLLFVGAGLLGVGTIEDLALILFVGLASGAYSSLFLATPIVVDLTEREPQYKALTKRVVAKRASEARRAEEAALTGATVAPKRTGAPAPAPKVGARPERTKRNR